MTTLEFFQHVLPDDGINYLVLFTKRLNDRGEPFKIHKAYSDLDSMAFAAIQFDEDPDYIGVYHACGGYLRPYIEYDETNEWGKAKKRYRVEENWHRAKSFWVDIDCGQAKHDSGEGYLDKTTALKSIFKFSDDIGWPRPTVVDSGNGLHCYWPLTKTVNAGSWRRVATLLKATLAHEGILADPTRTADFASILRTPGTHNRKSDQEKEVKLRRESVASEPRVLADALTSYAKEHGVKPAKESPKRSAPANADINSDLTAHLANFPSVDSSGETAASKCQQMRDMRDTQGDVTYEHWRGVIGVLVHCVDGRELAQKWSEERESSGHSQLDWETRFDTWSSGPTTCDFFEKCNPSGCEGCEFKGKVKSPILLGRVIPIAVEPKVEVEFDDGNVEEISAPALPRGYEWSGGLLARLMKDKDDIVHALPFSSILFYPISRIRAEDGTYRIGIRMHLPNKKVRDFEMSSEAMASQTDMLRSLAKYELRQSNHKDSGLHMAAYLRDQLDALMRNVEEVNTLTTFGWKDNEDSFLLGDRLIHKDGSVRRVLVGGGASKFAPAFSNVNGSREKYAEALNFLYNREGVEHFQYAICSGWGSVLTPFSGEELFNGLLVALRGGDSGKGKTTACFASMYAFGDAKEMTRHSKDGFTYNALWSFLGTFNNVPVLLDELTNMDPEMFSDLAYGVSNGQGKLRMTSKGGSVQFADTITWQFSPFITGNKDFHGLLASTQANSQAEAVRLIQINVDSYPRIKLHDDDGQEAELVRQCVDTMKANRGAAGEALIQHVAQHTRSLMTELRTVGNDLASHLPGPKYRFYRAHAACTLVIARVARDLGIIDFDLQRLQNFTIALLQQLAEQVTTMNTVTMEEAFNRMMADLTPRILVTDTYRDKRSKRGPESPRNRVNGAIAGRYVLGRPDEPEHAGHIMLNQRDVRDWCTKNRVDYEALLNQLSADGALVNRSEKLTLTRGTDVPSIQARCIVVDAYKIDKDHLTIVPNPAVVTDIKAVGGVS